jgi:outer membrane protein OmpA-like peptidoglycan-associated protein
MNTKIALRLLIATALVLGLGACATSKSVDEKIAAAQAQSSQKIESVSTQVEDLQQKQKATDAHLVQTDTQISQLSATAQDALKRAQDAGVLAKGKVVFEQTFTEDRVKFKSGKYDLDKDAQAALDEFAGKVKALTDPYFIEIQGHTDNVGGKRYNEDLGQRRAEAVRRYLSKSAGLPLNRMSTISYGDSAPVSDNKTKKGRAENRRVVLVVLE